MLFVPSIARANPKSHSFSPSAGKSERKCDFLHELANSVHVTFQVTGVEQDVLRFDVEMRDFSSVQVFEGLENFFEAGFRRVFGKGNFFVENCLQFTSSRPKRSNKRRKLIKTARLQFVGSNLHLKNQDKLAARLVHSVELNDLLGIGAQQQNSDLMLNLFDPAGSASSASQEFRSVVDTRFFVCRSPDGAEIASAREKFKLGKRFWKR